MFIAAKKTALSLKQCEDHEAQQQVIMRPNNGDGSNHTITQHYHFALGFCCAHEAKMIRKYSSTPLYGEELSSLLRTSPGKVLSRNCLLLRYLF